MTPLRQRMVEVMQLRSKLWPLDKIRCNSPMYSPN
jgi:hypothetical protein